MGCTHDIVNTVNGRRTGTVAVLVAMVALTLAASAAPALTCSWGVGFYYDAVSSYLKESLESTLAVRNEKGWELFCSFFVTFWLTVGADRQLIDPSLAD